MSRESYSVQIADMYHVVLMGEGVGVGVRVVVSQAMSLEAGGEYGDR